MTEEKNFGKIGGWLILVGLGIIFSPLRIITQLFPVYSNLFSNGSWKILTTPGTPAYHPLWAPILCGEMGINLGLVLAWTAIAYLFFTKRKIFPKWYITIMLFSLVFIVVDALAITLVLPDGPIFDEETTKEVGRSIVASVIWVPYMLRSKRVAATFVQ